jgi:hypothetical protein
MRVRAFAIAAAELLSVGRRNRRALFRHIGSVLLPGSHPGQPSAAHVPEDGLGAGTLQLHSRSFDLKCVR